MYNRRKTREVNIGGVAVGGDNPIAIQSMTNTDTRDVAATVAQIQELEAAGCEIVRVAVPDMAAAQALGGIKRGINIPLVADIHFDHRLALEAVRQGVDKLRINPGNIGKAEKVREVVNAAKSAGVPIRVGVNSGSVEKSILAEYGGVTAEGLAKSAMKHVRLLEENGFEDIIIAVKGSNIPLTLAAYEILAEQVDYPLHVGITESGGVYRGSIKSAAGLGAILSRGIGDTVRVSLTGDPVEEVRCARAILESLELRLFGPQIISCPTCGRTEIDLISLAERVEAYCSKMEKPLRVAVMGCVVNGPGEAREADIGIAGGRGCGLIFKKGEVIRRLPESELEAAFFEELDKMQRM